MNGLAVTYWLPYPPTVNHYWKHWRGRITISPEGREYRNAVQAKCSLLKAMEGNLDVQIVLLPPDRRRRDADNTLKAILDSLQHAGAYSDDSQIVRLDVRKLTKDERFPVGAVRVHIMPAKTDEELKASCNLGLQTQTEQTA